MKKLRFAQAGVSLMHANMYRDTLMLLPDELELVGFYDPDPEGVKANLKADVQGVPFYDSLADLLLQGKPDAVMVSTYLKDMPSWMVQVAEAGVHVWGEKPYRGPLERSWFRWPRQCGATICTFRAAIRGVSIRLRI